MSTCPNCKRPKSPAHYLCGHCWQQLPGAAKRALCRRDELASQRLLELLRQIRRGVPMSEVQVTA